MRVLITRPEPAASRSAARLSAIGHEAIVAPLLVSRALAWAAPEGVSDAVAFTSALAPTLGGGQLSAFTGLPAYVVGETTAAAARAIGFSDVRHGSGGAGNLFALAAGDGVRQLLHFAGRDRTEVAIPPGLTVTIAEVYAADLVPSLPADAARADLALVYSTRTAAHFADLVDAARIDRAGLTVAALGPVVAAALGTGWRRVIVAAEPNEDALFAASSLTCEKPD